MKRIKKVLGLLVLGLTFVLTLTGCTNSKSKVVGQYAPYKCTFRTLTEEDQKTPGFAITKDLKKLQPRKVEDGIRWHLEDGSYEIIDDMLVYTIGESSVTYYIKDNGDYLVYYSSIDKYMIYKKISSEVPANV